ncbi:tip elongation aberrant protein 1 isoform X1 [Nasonia vitripennis]|uniref:Tip elongation aberrant protein 1 n=2 Tax=Nasonia vitripennis TaxID=7425 RepID=A0A7M7M219_NASVI|nr:tip elongation aberrant protein 1 isoform X1 [Nasonia vitripennis]XP_016840017.1 tip elongation aberrant protein 1 isoform X1 [Nasonia vitripennis]
MWSSVTAAGVENGPAPPSRSKHSATLLAGHVYLLGGRNGNLPLKDLWRYSLAESRWEELHPSGERPPALQEHSAVAHKDCLYVFGGELGFSAGTETPLWCYSVKSNSWRKIRAQKGCAVPRGRRGHTALVHRGQMLIYGGYQDLRGSSSELWAFHFETESWHLLSSCDTGPPARHKHSAVLHGDAMYIYGGMTDLQERSDCWRWDVKAASWCMLKSKPGPGPLHGHAACRLPSCMLIFGGESAGLATNELWRFHFGTETWERLSVTGPKPQPRAESVALAVSELLIRGNGVDNNPSSGTGSCLRPRLRNNQRSNKCLSYGRVSPCDPAPTRPSFLREISKLSQINLSRLSHPNKCSYSVLSGQDDNEQDSPQEANSYYPFQQVDVEVVEPATGMVKSRSANTLARRRQRMTDPQRTSMIEPLLNSGMTREPVSVPNFRALTLPTPVLTPVEAARLVFVDPDEDTDDEEIQQRRKEPPISQLIELPEEEKRDFASLHQACQPSHGESYSSHLYEAVQTPKTPCTKLPNSASVRFADLEEGEESTSDYASIEARSPGDPLADDDWPRRGKNYRASSTTSQSLREGQFGFCNPNYLGLESGVTPTTPHTNSSSAYDSGLADTGTSSRYAKMLNSPPDSVLEDEPGRSASQTFAELLELQEMRPRAPPKSLPLGSPSRRAVSASRAERQRAKLAASESTERPTPGPAPLYVFLVGGKEKGQVTVFARPVSLWKLQLAPHIF